MAVGAHSQNSLKSRLKASFIRTSHGLSKWFLPPQDVVVLFHGVPDFKKMDKYLNELSSVAELISVEKIFDDSGVRTKKRPGVAFSFDDGLYSSYVAIKKMEKRSIKCAFFIPTAFIDAVHPSHFFENYLKQKLNQNDRPCTWEEIRDLAKSGHIIGSHTVTHASLSDLSAHELERELRQSQITLEAQTGQKVNWFANPFGNIESLNKSSIQNVLKYYDFCFTGVRGSTPRNSRLIMRQSIDIESPISVMVATTLGGADIFYRSARKALKKMEENADLGAQI